MTNPSARIRGTHLRSIIRHLPFEAVELGAYKKLLDTLDPEAWYDWSLYVDSARTIAARLPSSAIVNIGQQLVINSKDLFVEQGFTSLEQVFSDTMAAFRANTRDVSAEDGFQTVHASRGHAIIECGEAHVPELVEGFIRGFVELHGEQVISLSATVHSRNPTRYHFEVHYTSGSNP